MDRINKFRDEQSHLIEKYDITVDEIIFDYCSFLVFIAVSSGHSKEVMLKIVRTMKNELKKHKNEQTSEPTK
jgi:hypothetical protein